MSEAMRAAVSLYKDPRFCNKSEIRIRNNKLRRQRIVRRQFILLGLILSISIFSVIFLGSSFLADAQSDTYEPSYKYYKSVMVHSDDTVWSIATDYYSADQYDSITEYIDEICSLNSITDTGSLNAGEALIVPYYSTEFK